MWFKIEYVKVTTKNYLKNLWNLKKQDISITETNSIK